MTHNKDEHYREDKDKARNTLNKQIEEFKAKGGKIEICPPCTTSEEVTYKFKYGRGRPKKNPEGKKDA